MGEQVVNHVKEWRPRLASIKSKRTKITENRDMATKAMVESFGA